MSKNMLFYFIWDYIAFKETDLVAIIIISIILILLSLIGVRDGGGEYFNLRAIGNYSLSIVMPFWMYYKISIVAGVIAAIIVVLDIILLIYLRKKLIW